MAKATKKPMGARGGYDVGHERTVEYVSNLLTTAKFQVQHQFDLGEKSLPDLVANREHLGLVRSYVIEIALVKDNVDLLPRMDRLENYAANRKRPTEFDEFWLVSNLSLPERPRRRYHLNRIRAFTLKELERMLARLNPPSPKPPKGRTRIAKAVFANERPLHIAIAALTLLLDEKIEALKTYIPNDPDSIARKDASLREYQKLKTDLADIVSSIKEFNDGAATEPKIVKSVTTFSDGVRSWWNKSHDTICKTAFDMSMFASAVGICSLAGAGGNMTVAVSAVLVGGKPVADAIKSIAKRFGA